MPPGEKPSDLTFGQSGKDSAGGSKAALWTKADRVTYFDMLTIRPRS